MLTTGEFALANGLIKALRLYDELDFLTPA